MIQWEKISQDLGFRNERAMWETLYAKFSISQLATRFAVSVATIRKELHRNDVKIKPRGGKNYQKAELDEEMLQGIKARGVIQVAKERDLDVTTVYKMLYRAGLKVKDIRKDFPPDDLMIRAIPPKEETSSLPPREETPSSSGDPDGGES